MTMTPLCPTCHGDCCADKRGRFVVAHGAELARHSCPDCLDGFAPAPAPDLAAERLTALLDAEREIRARLARGGGAAPRNQRRDRALLDAERENTALRAEVAHLRGERAAVVAWLLRNHYDDTAERIERGEHRREEETK